MDRQRSFKSDPQNLRQLAGDGVRSTFMKAHRDPGLGLAETASPIAEVSRRA